MAALPTRHDKFFALSRVCRASRKTKTRPSKLGRGMLSCNPRAHWVLRLHFCRALSPQPHPKLNQRKSETKLENPTLKH